MVPSTSLPGSQDRFYWFKPGVLGNIVIRDCLKAWLGWIFIRQFHPKDRLKNVDPLRSTHHSVQFCTRPTQLKILYQTICQHKRTARNTCCQTRHEKIRWRVLQIAKPMSICIRQLYLYMYNLDLSAA
jgi:hypothetical protein